jgi:hypothetical protein
MGLRFKFVAAALCGLLLAVAPASAETILNVTYSTAFEFTSTGNNTVNLGLATFKLNGVTNNSVTTPNLNALFGTIEYNRNGQVNPLTQLFDFKLTVTQSAPPGQATSTSNIFAGSILINGGLAAVDFVSAPLEIGLVRYTPTSTSQLFIGNSGIANINGAVTAVPLPAAAWGGMALCAMVGVWKYRRKDETEV